MIRLSHAQICPYCQSGYLLPSGLEDPSAPEFQCNSCSVFSSEWEKENLGKARGIVEIPEELKTHFMSNGWSLGNLLDPDPKGQGFFYSSGKHRILLYPIKNGKWKASWTYDGDKNYISAEKKDPHKAVKRLHEKMQDAFDSFPWGAI